MVVAIPRTPFITTSLCIREEKSLIIFIQLAEYKKETMTR